MTTDPFVPAGATIDQHLDLFNSHVDMATSRQAAFTTIEAWTLLLQPDDDALDTLALLDDISFDDDTLIVGNISISISRLVLILAEIAGRAPTAGVIGDINITNPQVATEMPEQWHAQDRHHYVGVRSIRFVGRDTDDDADGPRNWGGLLTTANIVQLGTRPRRIGNSALFPDEAAYLLVGATVYPPQFDEEVPRPLRVISTPHTSAAFEMLGRDSRYSEVIRADMHSISRSLRAIQASFLHPDNFTVTRAS